MVSSDEEHVCGWVREYAVLSAEHHQTQRQLRANDASKKQMARNCHYFSKGKCDASLEGNICEMQCGKRNARVENGVLVFG